MPSVHALDAGRGAWSLKPSRGSWSSSIKSTATSWLRTVSSRAPAIGRLVQLLSAIGLDRQARPIVDPIRLVSETT